MIKPLRKYHLVSWATLAVSLPIFFTLSVALRPSDRSWSFAEEQFEVMTQATSDSTMNVFVKLLSPLRSPACTVYGITGNQKLLLGSVTRIGKHSFTCNQMVSAILFFDPVHKREIKTVNINPNK
jgi:hypothetical protein